MFDGDFPDEIGEFVPAGENLFFFEGLMFTLYIFLELDEITVVRLIELNVDLVYYSFRLCLMI